MNDWQTQINRGDTRTRGEYAIVGTGVDPHISTTTNLLPTMCHPFVIGSETRNQALSVLGERMSEKRNLGLKGLNMLDWHKIGVDEALNRLAVSPRTGLEQAQADRRHQQYGSNVLTPPKSHLFRKAMGWLFSGFGILLLLALVASIVCSVLGNDGMYTYYNFHLDPYFLLVVIILLILVVQVVLNATQYSSTKRVMTSIQRMAPADVLVLRDSSYKKIPTKELVPGDIVMINIGDKIPADLRLIEVSGDLQFDTSGLTGESEPFFGQVEMTDENFLETRNIALQGTCCVNGSGIGLVIQTGDHTVFGIIANLSSVEQSRRTPLQRDFLRFVIITITLATAVVILMVSVWGISLLNVLENHMGGKTLLIFLMTAIISFVPQGLPLVVTLSLAIVANTLSKRKILCKSLPMVETLGSVNVLCSDKTGTLTQNVMHVENIAIFDTVYRSDTLLSTLSYLDEATQRNVEEVVAVGAICNVAQFDETAPDRPLGSKKIVGNATDVAVLRFSDSISSADHIRQTWVHVYRRNFNSKDKYMLQLSSLAPSVKLDPNNPVSPLGAWDNFSSGSFLLTVKGAPDVLISRCSYVLNPAGGPPLPLTQRDIDRITGLQERWSSQGQRVILLARRVVRDTYLENSTDYNSLDLTEIVQRYNNNLIIVGLVGTMDLLKSDIKQTVSICRGAGIRFFIITGDHPSTALAIGAQAGIITDPTRAYRLDLQAHCGMGVASPLGFESYQNPPKSIVLTGKELISLSSLQLDYLCRYEEIVFARMTPEQKLSIVTNLMTRGNVVAVTGDGVNDAPALKAADCGIAMGDGSDVAKEAADLILLGEFSSIITAIERGRLVYDNLKKVIIYMLPAGSFSQLIPILFQFVVGVPAVLGAFQRIIICVAIDFIPALSLCMEPPEQALLLRKPRDAKIDRLVNWKLLLQAYGFLGALESLCAMSMAFWYLHVKGHPFWSMQNKDYSSYYSSYYYTDTVFKARSIYFFTLVIMQWGNLLATRGRYLGIFQHPISKNWFVIPAALISLGIGIFFSYIPFLQNALSTDSIPARHFFIPLSFAVGLLALDEIRKMMVRKYPKGILALLAW